ncbi:MAG: PAS domain-containing protein [Hyphomonadaceae bacterium]|nr:PAS domain-containing protein [Hyphomonadaceae bacterium]
MTRSVEFDHDLAQAIVDTIREPLLVLDADLCVIAASRSYYTHFGGDHLDTTGHSLFTLGDGQWDIPALRTLLTGITGGQAPMEAFNVELNWPDLSRRDMILNARKVFYAEGRHTSILLAIEDITERRAVERHRDQLLVEKDLLLQEMQHRVANSLQIIASILLLKARSVTSEETREHLRDAHKRVLAVAAVQQHLQATLGVATIELRSYLTQLCTSLGDSMIGEGQAIRVDVRASEGRMSSTDAVSIGLIVTELMINALKHAFPVDHKGSFVAVVYETIGPDWRLTVSDNGIGKPNGSATPVKVGLGTSIVAALAEQMQARIETVANTNGTSVAITHAEFGGVLAAA